MLFRKTLTMCAVALLAIGTSAFAQDVTTPLLGPVSYTHLTLPTTPYV